MYTIKELYADIRRRSFTDFTLNKGIMSYSWTQDGNGIIRRIGLGYRKYQSGFLLDPPNVRIRFNNVESILETVMNKYNIKNTFGEFPQFTVKGNTYSVKGVDYEIFNRFISDSEYFSGTEVFDFVFDEVETVVKYGAVPFFEKYSTLESVNEDLNKLNDENISDFLSGIVSLKIPLIKKLVNAPDFHKELLWSKNFYEGKALLYPQYFKDHDKVFFDLFAEDLKEL